MLLSHHRIFQHYKQSHHQNRRIHFVDIRIQRCTRGEINDKVKNLSSRKVSRDSNSNRQQEIKKKNFMPKYRLTSSNDIPIIYLLYFSEGGQTVCIQCSNEKLIDFFNSGELNRIINFLMLQQHRLVYFESVCVLGM